MIFEPDPWDEYSPAQLRLPGFSGAALFLRSLVLPAEPGPAGTEGMGMGIDVMTLTPGWHCWYMLRRPSANLVDRLAAFFFAAAADFHPESRLADFTDEGLGLTLSIVESTEANLTVECFIVQDQSHGDPGLDSMRFETTRAVMASAAAAVRCLDGSHERSPIEEFSS